MAYNKVNHLLFAYYNRKLAVPRLRP